MSKSIGLKELSALPESTSLADDAFFLLTFPLGGRVHIKERGGGGPTKDAGLLNAESRWRVEQWIGEARC